MSFIISYNLSKVRSGEFYYSYHLAIHLFEDGNRFDHHGTSRNEVLTALKRYINSYHGLLSFEPSEIDSRLRDILACGYTDEELDLTPDRQLAIKLSAALSDHEALEADLTDCVEAFAKLANLVERVARGYAVFDEGAQMKAILARRYNRVMTAIFWEAGRTSDFESLRIINAETRLGAADKLSPALVGVMTAERCGFPPDLYQEIISKARRACEIEDIIDGSDAA